MKWTAKDIQGGVLVTSKTSETSTTFQTPCIISRLNVEGVEANGGYVLIDLRDGYQFDWSKPADGKSKAGMSTEALAQYLTEHDFVPCPKMVLKGGMPSHDALPENRLGLPMLLVTHCGA
jgi:hypothetical protein